MRAYTGGGSAQVLHGLIMASALATMAVAVAAAGRSPGSRRRSDSRSRFQPRPSPSRDRPRLRDDLPHERPRTAAADRPDGRAVLRPRRGEAGARGRRDHRRDRPRVTRREPEGRSRRRLLRPGIRQRLLRVQARRRPRALDARRPVGRAALDRSPGNLYSEVRSRSASTRPRAASSSWWPTRLSRRSSVPADTQWVKRFKFQSPIADEVLGPADLPRRHRAAAARLRQGDDELPGLLRCRATSRSAPPLGFDPEFTPTERSPYNIATDWIKDDFPRMVVVTFQHPNPYFDDSYAVNSVNVGPYGDAIMQELIPEVEKRFRVIDGAVRAGPVRRVDRRLGVAGAPDLPPRLLRRHLVLLPRLGHLHRRRGHQRLQGQQRVLQGSDGWLRVPTINSREIERPGPPDLGAAEPLRAGQRHEGAVGRADRHLVGGLRPASARTATSSRCSTSGPARSTRRSPQYWRENYDLLHYLQQNWPTVGPKLVDKIHVYTGDVRHLLPEQLDARAARSG